MLFDDHTTGDVCFNIKYPKDATPRRIYAHSTFLRERCEYFATSMHLICMVSTHDSHGLVFTSAFQEAISKDGEPEAPPLTSTHVLEYESDSDCDDIVDLEGKCTGEPIIGSGMIC
jgi:hypothetical protein